MEQEKPFAGRLKIFFGYADGVGKTSAMLRAAHEARNNHIDVVIGFINTDAAAHPQTRKALQGLEVLPPLALLQDHVTVTELDLDAVIARRPQLVIIDELAHVNAGGCRHARRQQDVSELLKAGIDVYTTLNVQNVESLQDTVCSITGEAVSQAAMTGKAISRCMECVPDPMFDFADQVVFVDREPEELKVLDFAAKKSREQVLNDLSALRELAFRRCADRMSLRTKRADSDNTSHYHTGEHILVCLSSAPSNAKIIRTAARMANAFRGSFTALFVETPAFASMKEEDAERLQYHMQLARQLGAKLETVRGDDVPFQIAEFARLSGVSKIVIGRSTATRRHPVGKPLLTDRLIANAPNLDIHIIPDSSVSSVYHEPGKDVTSAFALSLQDLGVSLGILFLATIVSYLFSRLDFTESNIIMVYILGVLVTSLVTAHRAYSLISSIISVLIFNFFFTVPRYTFLAYEPGYPVTFLVMFLAAFLTGTLAGRLKGQARQAAQAAYRTKVLFDTNQLLQQAEGRDDIISAAAKQLTKLLEKDIIVYPAAQGELEKPRIFPVGQQLKNPSCIREQEAAVADWVLKNNQKAGASTDTFSDASCLYYAVRINDTVYGVVGIAADGQMPDLFESSILMSILGECALALENEKNSREKEEAAMLAQNEQLRANLLRSISHDLRTPLTSISGNASNLLTSGALFDTATKRQIYLDIYDDSMWLYNLVENLLSVTKIEEGRMNLHITTELVDEVIAEALQHINRRRTEHQITAESAQELILARMDARLIMQVIINIVDNAIKYTQEGSKIHIRTCQKGDQVIVRISDNGPGIPDSIKPQVFDMFFCGENRLADSRRSLGLGLALCRSIIHAHGGTISVSDNVPQGSVFEFTLQAGEVSYYE